MVTHNKRKSKNNNLIRINKVKTAPAKASKTAPKKAPKSVPKTARRNMKGGGSTEFFE